MKLKVLMFGWEFPPHNSGGLGVACKGLVSALAREGTEVTFVLPKKVEVDTPAGARMVFANVKNVEVVEVSSTLLPYTTEEGYERAWKKTENDGVYGSTLFEEVHRYGQKGREIALREDFDIIHAHDWLSFLAGVEAKKATGKPLVLHVHATEWDRSGGTMNPRVFELERYALSYADCIATVSEWTKQVLHDRYDVPKEMVEVVHNGVEEPESAENIPEIQAYRDLGYKTVLFVGRITIQKGPDYFIKLAKRVTEYRPKTVFVMSGSGDMEAQMIREAAELGISDKIIFTGFLRGAELRAVYQMADLFVMPSVSEPFGITPLESILNGTPVLISKQSGVSEVLKHSLTADFWDIDDMADKVLSALANDCLCQTLLTNGRENVRGINWKLAALKCTGVYRRLLDVAKKAKHQVT